MSIEAEAVQAVSKGVGAASFVTALSSSWWMAFPWADTAIIVSALGGTFFMIERFISMMIRITEFRKLNK